MRFLINTKIGENYTVKIEQEISHKIVLVRVMNPESKDLKLAINRKELIPLAR